MDTRNFDEAVDPWKGIKDVDVHDARDRQAAELRRMTQDHIAVPAGQALLRMPEFSTIQAPTVVEEAPLKRDRAALRRKKHGLFGKRR